MIPQQQTEPKGQIGSDQFRCYLLIHWKQGLDYEKKDTHPICNLLALQSDLNVCLQTPGLAREQVSSLILLVRSFGIRDPWGKLYHAYHLFDDISSFSKSSPVSLSCKWHNTHRHYNKKNFKAIFYFRWESFLEVSLLSYPSNRQATTSLSASPAAQHLWCWR